MYFLNFANMEERLQNDLVGLRRNGHKVENVIIGNPMDEYWKDKIEEATKKAIEKWVQTHTYMGFPVVVDPLMPVNQIKIMFRNFAGLLDQITITGIMEEKL